MRDSKIYGLGSSHDSDLICILPFGHEDTIRSDPNLSGRPRRPVVLPSTCVVVLPISVSVGSLYLPVGGMAHFRNVTVIFPTICIDSNMLSSSL